MFRVLSHNNESDSKKNNYESVDPAADVYDVPDDEKYVNEHVTIKCLMYISFILHYRPDISTDNIEMQACEVYGLNKFNNKTSTVNM